MAALRNDPQLAKQTYSCIRLPDGRVGNYLRGSNRPIRDDIEDKSPHGTIDMERAVIVSCNAYFAQLGTYNVGAQHLFDTGTLLGISMAAPATAQQLRKSLPQSSYGQGSSRRLALPDGACGGGHRQRRPTAARPLDRRRKQRSHPGAAARDRPGCRRHHIPLHARSGDRGHGPERRRMRRCKSRARPAPRNSPMRLPTPGSSGSRRIRPAGASRSRC
jgi:hypothetical protein